jgi:hypothetical protein
MNTWSIRTGGGVDVAARTVAAVTSVELGQQMVREHRVPPGNRETLQEAALQAVS